MNSPWTSHEIKHTKYHLMTSWFLFPVQIAFSHSSNIATDRPNIKVMRENWSTDGGSILILGLLLKKWRNLANPTMMEVDQAY